MHTTTQKGIGKGRKAKSLMYLYRVDLTRKKQHLLEKVFTFKANTEIPLRSVNTTLNEF